MNYIDLIVLLTLAIAIFNGWRQGAIVQLCSIVGVVISIWLGIRYGAMVGEWLQIGGGYASVSGSLIVIVGVLVVVTLISRIIKRLFKFVGLGALDLFVGIVLSVCKYTLILSILFGAFDSFNSGLNIVNNDTLSKSKFYRPIIGVSSSIFPALEDAQKLLKETQKQITSEIEKLQ